MELSEPVVEFDLDAVWNNEVPPRQREREREIQGVQASPAATEEKCHGRCISAVLRNRRA